MTAPLASSSPLVGILDDGFPRAVWLPPSNYEPLRVFRATDQRLPFRAYRSSGSPIDLTNWLLVFTVKQHTDLGLSALVSRMGFQDKSVAANAANFDISASDTARICYGRYVYDIRGRYQGLWYELVPTTPFWLEPNVGVPNGPLTVVSPVVFYVANPPLIQSFNIVGPLVFEVGDTLVDPTFGAAYSSYPGSPTGVDLTDGTHDVALTTPYNVGVLPFSYTNAAPNALQVFTLLAHQPGGLPDDTATITAMWQPKVFWGASVTGTFNAAFIQALVSSQLQPSLTSSPGFSAGAGQYLYFAAPSSYGGVPGDFVNFATGLAIGMSKVASGVSVTNGFSVALNYDLWQSDVADLGAITMRVAG